MKQRPKCVRCGKGYGSRSIEEKRFYMPEGLVPEPMPSNLQLVRHRSWRHGDQDGKPLIQHVFEYWDGETFTGLKYKPFCSQACTLAYARDMYARHS